MTRQTTNCVIMIEPRGFRSNPDTLKSNAFQHKGDNPEGVNEKAVQEMRAMRKALEDRGITVSVYEGNPESPDDIFPNNWISTHQSGRVVLYPMLVKSRSIERRKDIIETVSQGLELWNISDAEAQNLALEGTGSLVLDRVHKTAYLAVSERSDLELARKWADYMGYDLVAFKAYDRDGLPIYHTNVVMFVGSDIAGICLEAVVPEDRESVLKHLERHHEVIDLSMEQLYSFCGNMLEMTNDSNETILIMSQTAWEALDDNQKKLLEDHTNHIIAAPIPTIEHHGGGSVRCMLLEVF